MKFIKQLNFANRLYLLLLIPILGILFFAIMGIIDKSKSAQDMEYVGQLALMATKVSALVHETQKERGATALFMGSRGGNFQAQLNKQRQQTDTKRYQLNVFFLSFERSQFGQEFNRHMDKVQASLDRLSSLRKAVNALSVSLDDAISQYTALNTKCLDLIAMIPRLSPDAQVGIISNAYMNFLKGKERAGIERAVVSGILTSGVANKSSLKQALSLGIQQEVYFGNFSLSALPHHVKKYQAFQQSAISTTVAQYRKDIVDQVENLKALEGSIQALDDLLKINDEPAIVALDRLSHITEAINFKIDASSWFETSTKRINGLKAIEDEISTDLIAHASTNKAAAINSLIFYGIFVVLVVGVTFILSAKLHKSKKRLGEKESELNLTRYELVQSEKIASLGRMVAGFAHEVNTPIGIAVGAISQAQQSAGRFHKLLEQEEVEEKDLTDNIDTIAKVSALAMSNLNRAARLVRSFKRTSIDQASEQSRKYNVKNAVEDVLYTLNSKLKKTGISVKVACPDDIQVMGQPGRFDQLVTNLVLNSYLHGFENGAMAGEINIGIRLKGDMIAMEYADTGVGMDQATVDKIFEPFFTTSRSDGSGLGMYLCYSIVVNDMKGRIRCVSAPGTGARFEVVFPVGVSK